jgi:D-arginine dehydrogenase
MDSQPFDVVILGAGIAGASLAWRLAPHRRVLLVEREAQPGMHSTGRSAAMFMQSYGPPQVRALTRASRAFYMQPPAGFSDVPILRDRGVLYVAQPGQQDLLEAQFKALSATCPTLERYSKAQTLAAAPCLRPERVLAAIHEPDAMDIDVNALHQGFLRGFKARGAATGCELRTGLDVQSVQHISGHWQLRFADGVCLDAHTVVNATGAWADHTAALLGARPIGLVPKRRSAFTFRAPVGVDASTWPLVAGLDDSYYFKPDAGQLLGSPGNADITHAHDVQPQELDIALGIHAIQEATTLQITRPTSTWAGLRSFVPDGELVIGFDTTAPHFFWLAGQGGYGIQSAAGASALADALIRKLPLLPEELLREGVKPAAMSPCRLPS